MAQIYFFFLNQWHFTLLFLNLFKNMAQKVVIHHLRVLVFLHFYNIIKTLVALGNIVDVAVIAGDF